MSYACAPSLGYYPRRRFPLAQGQAAGPYGRFPGARASGCALGQVGRRRRRRLGQDSSASDFANEILSWDPFSPFAVLPSSADLLPETNSWYALLQNAGFSDLLQNAATGNLTQDEITNTVNAQAANYQAAGMPPAQAQSQAQQDVTTALSTFSGPGAFGVNWTGALPSSTSWYDILSPGNSVNNWLAQNWIWLALGGAAFIAAKGIGLL